MADPIDDVDRRGYGDITFNYPKPDKDPPILFYSMRDPNTGILSSFARCYYQSARDGDYYLSAEQEYQIIWADYLIAHKDALKDKTSSVNSRIDTMKSRIYFAQTKEDIVGATHGLQLEGRDPRSVERCQSEEAIRNQPGQIRAITRPS
jgi:hypothetical protein